jgi:hypothetical protein
VGKGGEPRTFGEGLWPRRGAASGEDGRRAEIKSRGGGGVRSRTGGRWTPRRADLREEATQGERPRAGGSEGGGGAGREAALGVKREAVGSVATAPRPAVAPATR